MGDAAPDYSTFHRRQSPPLIVVIGFRAGISRSSRPSIPSFLQSIYSNHISTDDSNNFHRPVRVPGIKHRGIKHRGRFCSSVVCTRDRMCIVHSHRHVVYIGTGMSTYYWR